MNYSREQLIEIIRKFHKATDSNTDYYYGYYYEYPIEKLHSIVDRYIPTGEKIKPEDVVDITLSYEVLCKMFPEDNIVFKSFDYNQYDEWLNRQLDMGDCYYYSREKHDFFVWEAYELAAKLGRKYVIMENMS